MNAQARGALLLAALAAACGGEAPRDQETGTITPESFEEARARLPASAMAQLDSGNAAYRAEDFQAAATHYRTAAREAPDAPAAWFGIYMAERALGNTAAADSAMRRAQSLAGDAGLVHPDTVVEP
ncbi:MAG TPA: tetratricopeptide repeat protein [Longimicrobiales bacterium]|nr:tetratricopeptide repeat protein [Longimicrobiales bacterium]